MELVSYPVVATDALLGIGTAVIVCRSMITCHKLFLCPEMWLTVDLCLFCTSLPGYALLNASRIAATDFDTK
jgi:hypothetical protein